MGILRQLGLLLKQNFIERKRNWAVLLLEILWPVLLFIAIVVFRKYTPAEDISQCKYLPTALPSAGVFPFMQSIVCNVKERPSCVGDGPATARQTSSQALSGLTGTLMDEDQIFVQLSQNLERSLPMLTTMQMALDDMQDFLALDTSVRGFLKDPKEVRRIMVEDYGLNETLVDTILLSQIDITKARNFILVSRASVCDFNESSSPLSKYILLPSNATVSMKTINEELCKIPDSSISELIKELQDQLNGTAIANMLKKALSFFVPDANAIFDDLGSLLRVIEQLGSFNSLSSEMPNVGKILDWTADLLAFVNTALQQSPIQPEQLGQLLERLDPIITSFSNNSKVWQDIKRGIYFLDMSLGWAKGFLHQLPDMKITLGTLYAKANLGLLDHLNRTIANGVYLTSVLQRSTISLPKLIGFQATLSSMGAKPDELCTNVIAAFFDMFEYPSDTDLTSVLSITTAATTELCRMNQTYLFSELATKLDVGSLIQEFAGYANSTVGERPLNWTSIVTNGWELIDVLMNLQGYLIQYEPVLKQLAGIDISGLMSSWQAAFAGNMSSEQILGLMMANVDQVQSGLETTPYWPAIRDWLIGYSLYSDLIEELLALGIDSANKTHRFLSDPSTRLLAQKLTDFGPDVTLSLLKQLTKPATLRTIIADPVTFLKNACDNISMVLDIVDLPGFNLAENIQNVVCRANLSLSALVGAHDRGAAIQQKVERLILVYTNISLLNLTSSEQMVRMSDPLRRGVLLSERLGVAIRELNFEGLLDLTRLNGTGANWTAVYKYLETVPTYIIIANILESVGPIVESSGDPWIAQLRRMIAAADRTAAFTLQAMQAQTVLFSENTAFGRVYHFVSRYGPDLISAQAELINNPSKLTEALGLLAEVEGNPLALICNATLFSRLYNLTGVPMESLRADLCSPNASQVILLDLNNAFGFADFVDQINRLMNATDVAIDTGAITNRLTNLPTQLTSLFTQLSSLITSFNATAWQKAGQKLMSALSAVNPNNLLSLMDGYGAIGLQQLDTALKNESSWHLFKHIINALDVIIVRLADRLELIKTNGLTLDVLFSNSTMVKQYLSRQVDTSPVIIDAFFNTLIDPSKLLTNLVTMNFTGKSWCNGISVSQFVDMSTAADMAILENAFCSELDYNGFWTELQADETFMTVSRALAPIIYKLTNDSYELEDIPLNMDTLTAHLQNVIQSSFALQNFTGPILPDMPAQNLTLLTYRARAAVDRYINRDMDQILLISTWDKFTEQLKRDQELNTLGHAVAEGWKQVLSQLSVNIAVEKMILQQAKSLDGKASFSLSDLVLPEELHRLMAALDPSPAMTDVLLYSIFEVMRDGSKLKQITYQASLLDDLCTNLTVYQAFFSLPPDSSLNMADVQKAMCALRPNITLLYEQLLTTLDGAPELLKAILDMSANQTWPQATFASYYNTTYEVSKVIEGLVARKVQFIAPNYTNPQSWNSTLLLLERLASSLNDPNLLVQALVQTAPMFNSLIANSTDGQSTVQLIALSLQASVNFLDKLEAANWRLDLVLVNTTVLGKYYNLVNKGTEYLDIILQTMLQPEKMAPLIKLLLAGGPDYQSTFCGIADLDQYVVRSAGNQANVSILKDLVCSSDNMTAWQDFISLISGPSGDITKTAATFGVENLIEEAWNLYHKYPKSLQILLLAVNSKNPLQGIALLLLPGQLDSPSLDKVIGDFLVNSSSAKFDYIRVMKLLKSMNLSYEVSGDGARFFHVVNTILDIVLRKLENLENANSPIEYFVQNSPETVKVVNYILENLPDITEGVFSLQSQQNQILVLFQQTMTDPFATLCGNSSGILNTPVQARLKMTLCSFDWNKVKSEIFADWEADQLSDQSNNTAPVAVSSTVDRLYNMSIIIVRLLESSSLTPAVDPKWQAFNQTLWLEMLKRQQALQAQPARISANQIFEMLGAFFGKDPNFQKFVLVLEKLLAELRADLQSISQGRDLTVKDMFARMPVLGELIQNSLELSPDTYSLLLSMSIKDPQRLLGILSSEDIPAAICNSTIGIAGFVDIPDSVDMAAVTKFLCSRDLSNLVQNIVAELGLEQMANLLNSTQTPDINKISDHIQNITDLITKLTQNPPSILSPFNPKDWENITVTIIGSIDWSKPDAYLNMSESLIGWMKQQPFWELVQPYAQINEIIIEWVYDLLDQLRVDDSTKLNLASLFPNATLLHDYIRASMAVDYNDLLKLLGVSLNPQKMIELVRLIESDQNVTYLCDPSQLAAIFPAGTNLTQMQTLLCSIARGGSPDLLQQMLSAFKVENVLSAIGSAVNGTSTRQLSVRQTFDRLQGIIQKIQALANVTQIFYNNANIASAFGNKQSMEEVLLTLTENLPAFEIQTIGEVLDSLMPYLKTTDWWPKAEIYFQLMNLLAEVGANRTARLPTVNITLSSLIRDADALARLLRDSYAFGPDLLKALIEAQLSISPSDLRNIRSPLDIQQLLCNATYPSDVNATAVRTICSTDFVEVVDQLLLELDFELLIVKFQTLPVVASASSDFSWTDLLMNTNRLAQNLGVLFASLTVPPVQEFFEYKGNMSAYMKRLEELLDLSSPDKLGKLFKIIGSNVNQLSPLFEEQDGYKALIAITRVMKAYMSVVSNQLYKVTGVITLNDLLMNNTGLVTLFEAAFGAAPDALNLLLTEPMQSSQLLGLIGSNTDLCHSDLSKLFTNTSTTKIQTLQSALCSLNYTALMLEIEAQINYSILLPLQSMRDNSTAFDWADFVNEGMQLFNAIKGAITSPPKAADSLSNLVNEADYLKLIANVKSFWLSQRLDVKSLVRVVDLISPMLGDTLRGTDISRWISALNAIMSTVNRKLQGVIQTNEISLDSLLGSATHLKNYLQDVLKAAPNVVDSLLNSRFLGDSLLTLIVNPTEFCSLTASQMLSLPANSSMTQTAIKNIICKFNVTAFSEELKQDLGITSITDILNSNSSAPADLSALFANSQLLAEIVTNLTLSTPTLSAELVAAFNLSKNSPIISQLQSFKPEQLLSLLRTYGPLLQELSGENWPLIQNMLYSFSTSLGAVTNQLNRLAQSGMTLNAFMNNATAMRIFLKDIVDNTMSTAIDMTYEMMEGEMTCLLARPEVESLVCNQSALMALLPNLPSYVNLTGALCGSSGGSWLNNMKQANYSPLEVAMLLPAIYRWYFEQGSRYNTSAAIACRSINPITSNFSIGDLVPQIGGLVSVLRNLQDVSALIPNFNTSHWNPIIQTFLAGYAQDLPEVVIRQLELMDPLLRDVEFWNTLQNTLRSTSEGLSLLNDKLEALDKSGESISLVSILPDVNAIRQLLSDAVGPDSAAEFLTTVLHPDKVMTVVVSNPTAVFCNQTAFLAAFVFPPGVNATAIQQKLCNSVQNNSLILQRLLDALDMNMLSQEVTRLLNKITSSQPTQSPYRQILSQVQRLLQNADVVTRLLQAFDKNMPDVSQYLTTLSSAFAVAVDPQSQNVGQMCNAVINLVDETDAYKEMLPYLAKSQSVTDIVNDMVSAMMNLDNILCDLPNMNLTQIIRFATSPTVLNLFTKFQMLLAPQTQNPVFLCSQHVQVTMDLQTNIQQVIKGMSNGSLDKCISELATANFTVLNDLTSFKTVLSSLQVLLSSDVVSSLAWLEPIRPIIDQIVRGLMNQVQVAQLDALVNRAAIESLLGTQKQSNLNDLFSSQLSVDVFTSLLKKAVPEAEALLCNSSTLSALFVQTTVSISEVQSAFCNRSGLVEATIKALNTAKLNELAATKDVNDFVKQLAIYLEALINQVLKLGSLTDLASITQQLDFTTITQNLPKFMELLSDPYAIENLFASIHGILDLVESRVVASSNSSVVGVLMADLKTVVQGIAAMKSLNKFTTVTITVGQIFASRSEELRTFLVKTIGLSEQAVDELLASKFTANMLQEMTTALDFRSDICDADQLAKMLTLPKSSILTYSDVSRALCDINSTLAVDIGVALVKQMDLANMIESALATRGIDVAEAKKVFAAMATIQESLQLKLEEIDQATSMLNLSQTDTQSGSATAGQESALKTFSQSFCGQDGGIFGGGSSDTLSGITGFLGDDVSGVVKEMGSDDFGSRVKRSHIAEPACAEIEKSIRDQPGGDVFWGYVKPLLLGKILFTPDNNVTRKIMEGANKTLSHVARLFQSADSIVASNNMLQNSLNGTSGIKDLAGFQAQMSNPLVKSFFDGSFNPQSFSKSLKMFTDPEKRALVDMLSSMVKYGKCVDLNMFVGVSNEEELEKEARRLYKTRTFLAGVVFLGTEPSRRRRDATVTIPKHVQYKIRMDVDMVQQTMKIGDDYYRKDPRDDNIQEMRYLRGFIQLQDMIDRSIIDLHGQDPYFKRTESFMQQMPATCYSRDSFMGFVYPYIVPVIMSMSWLFTVAHSVKAITNYREFGLEEAMKIMGLKHGLIFWSWLISTLLGMCLISAIAAIIMVIGQVLTLSNGLIVFLFFATFSLSTTMFCYMVSSFFTKANVAAAVAVMLYLISYLPFVIYTQFRDMYQPAHYHVTNLLSTTAFAIGATFISRWEQMGEGIQWSNVNQVPGYNERGELSVAWLFYWMLIDSVIYFVIGWYFRNVLPSKYGVRRPLYFPFTASYWSCRSGHRTKLSSKIKDSEFGDLPVGVSIQSLHKKYKNGMVAVKNLTMNFYEGHVTAFLGRNGAGKTTTINVLTGLMQPSDGTAYIDGWNIRSNMNDARQSLGYCPQFDMLFDFMTVKEHLDFFATLKSQLHTVLIRDEVNSMLHAIGLWNVRDEMVGELSGGMRRRLSVAIAFIGDSKVIILDEPTSSIDPNGRRAIWDLILKHRVGRTIILCTHHLDEADTLGDRVAILDKGQLLTHGTPMDLKKRYGSGYQLFLDKRMKEETKDVCDVGAVSAFVKQFIPSADLTSNVGRSLTYTLPAADVPAFDTLFTELNKNLDTLHLTNFGVSESSLDEVFQTIAGDEAIDTEDDREIPLLGTRTTQALDFGQATKMSTFTKLQALFAKRALHTVKDVRSYLALVILPVAFVALALGFSKLTPNANMQPNLELQTSLYRNSYSFFSKHTDNASVLTGTLFERPGLGTVCMADTNLTSGYKDYKFTCSQPVNPSYRQSSGLREPLPACQCTMNTQFICTGSDPQLNVFSTNSSELLVELEGYDIADYLLATTNMYKAKRYGGWSFEAVTTGGDDHLRAAAWFDNRAFHSMPIYLNALNNMILRGSIPRAERQEYGITVYNHPMTLTEAPLSIDTYLQKTADLGISLTLLAAFSFIPAGLCMYLVSEYIHGEKHLQYVSGVSAMLYWTAAFLWDMIMFLIPIGLTLLIMWGFNASAYSSGQSLLAYFSLLILYGFAILPFMYMLVKLFKNTTTAFFTLLMLNLFVGIILSVTIFLLNFFKYEHGIQPAYTVLSKLFLIFPQYSFTQAIIQMNLNSVLSEMMALFGGSTAAYLPFTTKNGIVWNLVSLAVQGVVFFVITVLCEIKSTSCAERALHSRRSTSDADALDEDVVAEQKRALEGQWQPATLTVQGLSKWYQLRNMKSIMAVKGTSFAVQQGEIFGLCGVNGAGKTSTFRMLTGELKPSEGSALLHNRPITAAASRRLIGYCPQTDALDDFLTGYQLLDVYATMKGIKHSSQAIENVANALDMQGYLNTRIGSYSGGMKRKLCVAISFLGKPELILLDEPTAGMDPVSRKTVWNQILNVAGNGSSVVLTSHSMAECDALCTRMTIMLNGQFQCIGSAQHLKNKFGSGYTVKIKSIGPLPHLTQIITFIKAKFEGAILKDQHLNTAEFYIPLTSGSLGYVFKTLEQERNNMYIEQYSVFQTTLDQVFLHFARQQQDQIDKDLDNTSSSSSAGDEERYVAYTNAALIESRDDILLSEKKERGPVHYDEKLTYSTHF